MSIITIIVKDAVKHNMDNGNPSKPSLTNELIPQHKVNKAIKPKKQ